MTPAEVFVLIVVLVWSFLLVSGVRERRRTFLLSPKPATLSASVTAMMPARNESEVIEAALDGVFAQDGLSRFVAIDDRSTDDTRSKMIARGVELFDGAGPGDGECGKPAALASAYASLKPDTDWLLFVDADVILEPGALHAMVEHAASVRADLVTLLPRLTLASAVEKIVMPSIGALIVAQYRPARVADPKRPEAFANGQVILIRRELYERVGTHRAVVREILEDVRLAERVKAAGGRLEVVDGRHLATTRMYDGWRELREGWTKNLFLLMGSSPPRALLWIVLSVTLGWSGWIALGVARWPWGVVALVFVVLSQMLLRRGGGIFALWAVFAPFGALATAFVLAESTWRHVTGRSVAWKGREL